jgi:hypothetical protein
MDPSTLVTQTSVWGLILLNDGGSRQYSCHIHFHRWQELSNVFTESSGFHISKYSFTETLAKYVRTITKSTPGAASIAQISEIDIFENYASGAVLVQLLQSTKDLLLQYQNQERASTLKTI